MVLQPARIMTAPVIPRGAAREHLKAFDAVAAVFITDDGVARNLTFNVDTSTVAGGTITATSSGESGIDVESNNGSSISIATGSAGKAGSVVNGGSYGIYAFTTGGKAPTVYATE